MRELQAGGPAPIERLFPEPGGLLPWGGSLAGHSYWWETSPDDPDDWTVLALSPTGERRRFPLSVTELLAAWITGSLGGEMLPRPAPDATPYFDRAMRRGGLIGRIDEPLSVDQCIGLLRRHLGPVHVRWHTAEPETATAHVHALEADWLATIRRTGALWLELEVPEADVLQAELVLDELAATIEVDDGSTTVRPGMISLR